MFYYWWRLKQFPARDSQCLPPTVFYSAQVETGAFVDQYAGLQQTSRLSFVHWLRHLLDNSELNGQIYMPYISQEEDAVFLGIKLALCRKHDCWHASPLHAPEVHSNSGERSKPSSPRF